MGQAPEHDPFAHADGDFDALGEVERGADVGDSRAVLTHA